MKNFLSKDVMNRMEGKPQSVARHIYLTKDAYLYIWKIPTISNKKTTQNKRTVFNSPFMNDDILMAIKHIKVYSTSLVIR